eukprot:532617-Amphidinium_carterae.1
MNEENEVKLVKAQSPRFMGFQGLLRTSDIKDVAPTFEDEDMNKLLELLLLATLPLLPLQPLPRDRRERQWASKLDAGTYGGIPLQSW